MPLLKSQAGQSAIGRVLLAAGCGAALGIQNWRLAAYGFGVSVPWYGSLWIVVSYTMLGLAIGATAEFAPWWPRGCALGILFSIPSVFGLRGLGLKGAPYGVAVMVAGLVSALLVAFLTDHIVPCERRSRHRSRALHPPGSATRAKSGGSTMDEIRQRLAAEKAGLEELDAERERRGDSRFGKAAEDRIVWNELLDLELQDIDEHVSRIVHRRD